MSGRSRLIGMSLWKRSLTSNAVTKSALADPREVSLQLRKRLGKDFALDISISFPPGITILFGPSGAGKTTLLDCMAGLATPDSGRIATAEKTFFDCSLGINLPPQRRKVGYVFQDLALFPHLTVQRKRRVRTFLVGQKRAEAAQRRHSGIIPHSAPELATPGADFRWRTAESCAGACPGDRSGDPSAG